MKNIFKKTALTLSIGLLSMSAFASGTTKDIVKDPAIQTIEKSINETIGKNPEFKLGSITAVEGVPGIYEVIHNRKEIFYINSTGTHIIDGAIIKLDGFDNITANKKVLISKVDLKDLPKDPIILKQGKGEHKLAVFADPNCTHCKTLEPELHKLTNVTVSIYPLPILSEDSQVKSESILCTKKPGDAWTKWMLEGVEPKKNDCSAGAKKVNNNLNFAKEYGITSTPTIIFANGEVATGTFPAEKIQEYFQVLKEKEDAAKEAAKKTK